jgi:two-component system sensor histidine kinase MtrB
MTARRGWTSGHEPERERRRSAPPVAIGTAETTAASATTAATAMNETARFLAEATHELRGGVARLALMAEALAEQSAADERDPRLSPRLRALAAEGRRVRALASALLDVVQLAEEGRRLDAVPVRVAVVLDGVLAGEPAGDEHVVEVRVADDLAVLADPLALDQILSNLVGNALRHGGRQVTVEGWTEHGRVVVAVTDDGPGIPDERADQLFSPVGRGLRDGLGLTIAAQLVALQQGDIRNERNEPSGARFVLRLPQASAAAVPVPMPI